MARVLPRMCDVSEARHLIRLNVQTWEERRRLRLEVGPAYSILTGMPMRRYKLDLSRASHRLCARCILAVANRERTALLAKGGFDTSKRGNWEVSSTH
jgi:hypothetical protein